MSVAYHHGTPNGAECPAAAQEEPSKRLQIGVYDSIVKAEKAWQQLDANGALATPYQRYGWVALWHRFVSGPAGEAPLIVVGHDSQGAPGFLWPFVRRRHGPLVIAGYFGGRHANLNAGIWRSDVANAMTAAHIRSVLADVGRQCGVDLYALTSQPEHIGAVANPFKLLPRQPSPDDVHSLHFGPFADAWAEGRGLGSGMRHRLRGKERKLKQLDGYRYVRATTAEDVDRLLDAFVQQKAAHFAKRGIANAFARPEIETFLRTACHEGLDQGRPIVELHALEGDGEVMAVFGGTCDDQRASFMFNSYTLGESGRWSPGLILMSHIVADSAARKFASVDFGVGSARYKSFFCKSPENTFDSFVAVTPVGHLAAATLRSGMGLKRWIKSSPALMSGMDSLRRAVLG